MTGRGSICSVFLVRGHHPHLTAFEHFKPLRRALAQQMIDEAIDVTCFGFEHAVMHRHQPSRSNFFRQLRGLGNLKISGHGIRFAAADRQERDRDAVGPQAVGQARIRHGIARVVNVQLPKRTR